ncbi:hypothetical protein BLA29_015520, partial [Euroglyphus maynei]
MGDNDEKYEKKTNFGKIFEGVVGGGKAQTRFILLKKKNLSRETVAGILDTNLGKIKNGKPI